MRPRVHFLGKPALLIRRDLLERCKKELRTAFPEATVVTVCDLFDGYSRKQDEKLVLGVEVRSRNTYHTHIVKLGTRDAVGNDYVGWHRCVLKHGFSSRVFMPVEQRVLPDNRRAIIYANAYAFFGDEDGAVGAQPLEQVIHSAIHDGTPAPSSVHRVIRQIYSDLDRGFYRYSQPGPRAARAFYLRQIRKAAGRWEQEEWRHDLRRDLIWMLDGDGEVRSRRQYIDPCDYVCWVLEANHLPQTLVGRSHGDLHGRNVLVGIQRGEAEYPAVFDYGEMQHHNVLVWDFVKLETELKVRLLLPLYGSESSRELLLLRFRQRHGSRGRSLLEGVAASPDPLLARVAQAAFALEFEHLLSQLTDEVYQLVDPADSDPFGGIDVVGDEKLKRALGILARIRREAAISLGRRQKGRGQRSLWKDEYRFALAVYGVSTAKFDDYDYQRYLSLFAMISAGVAAAQIETVAPSISNEDPLAGPQAVRHLSRLKHPYSSYLVPLQQLRLVAQRPGRTASVPRNAAWLDEIARRFDHAVPLLQEYALVLARGGRHDEALRLLTPLEDLCETFRDYETLSRIGRLFKDLGDEALSLAPVPFADLEANAAWQYYRTAYKRYRKAFQLRREYYPGINAATLARLCGLTAESRRLAQAVIAIIRNHEAGDLTDEKRFWLLATHGEALLLLGKVPQAARLYRQALVCSPQRCPAIIQSAYAQVRRLRWAIGPVAEPVLDLFRSAPAALHGNAGKQAPQPRGNWQAEIKSTRRARR